MDSGTPIEMVPASAAQGRPSWLFPRPFTAVSTLLYLGILALFFYGRLVEAYRAGLSRVTGPVSEREVSSPRAAASPVTWHWNEAVAVGAVLALLAIDRVEYRLFGETPRVRVAVGLLGLRVVLIEVVAQLDQF